MRTHDGICRISTANAEHLPFSNYLTAMGKPRGCGGSCTEPAEGWEGKDIDLVGVCIPGSPTANRPTKNKAICGQYRSLMLALGNS
jgi:hypothetical protein